MKSAYPIQRASNTASHTEIQALPLAEVLVLDPFSRNIFRDTPRSFAQDPLALVLAQELIAGGHDQRLTPKQRAFAYMPHMHSESLPIHA